MRNERWCEEGEDQGRVKITGDSEGFSVISKAFLECLVSLSIAVNLGRCEG